MGYSCANKRRFGIAIQKPSSASGSSEPSINWSTFPRPRRHHCLNHEWTRTKTANGHEQEDRQTADTLRFTQMSLVLCDRGPGRNKCGASRRSPISFPNRMVARFLDHLRKSASICGCFLLYSCPFAFPVRVHSWLLFVSIRGCYVRLRFAQW
jgi:hypothetical protein